MDIETMHQDLDKLERFITEVAHQHEGDPFMHGEVVTARQALDEVRFNIVEMEVSIGKIVESLQQAFTGALDREED